jgi:hypothetical protein
LADLAHWPELAKEIEEFLWSDVEAQVLHEESSVDMTC